jgi:hypothetical protein
MGTMSPRMSPKWALLGLLLVAGAARAQDSQSSERSRAVSAASSFLSARVENFVTAAHPLSYHDSFEVQAVRKRSDGGYQVVFDEYYKGRILGRRYWAEISVDLSSSGQVEGYRWGSDSNFYPPELARKLADKLLQ